MKPYVITERHSIVLVETSWKAYCLRGKSDNRENILNPMFDCKICLKDNSKLTSQNFTW